MYKYAYDLGILCLRVSVGPLDFKQEFYLYLEFGASLTGCLVGEQPTWLWEMKVLITSRSWEDL